MIEKIGERRTVLTRSVPGDSRRVQMIASNVDLVLVVTAVREPPLRPAFIDRMLIGASRGGMDAAICVNKIDLDPEGDLEATKVYESVGFPVVRVSVLERTGIEALRQLLAGRTTVFAGHSGVGKSSLLAALQPGIEIRIGAVSERTGKGTHTTTSASLIPLDFGGYVVDTPGIRTFGVVGLEMHEVGHHYPEMRDRLSGCRYKTCSHTHEPQCRVKEAVESGEIAALRYASYEKIVESIRSGQEGEERVRPT
jgi:ribosome biogenesis GTPase